MRDALVATYFTIEKAESQKKIEYWKTTNKV